MLHICYVEASKGNACILLGRNRCHILREIPTIGHVFTGLKRVATDSLHSSAQSALDLQGTPHPYMVTFSFHKMLKQDMVKLFNRRYAMLVTGLRNIQCPA